MRVIFALMDSDGDGTVSLQEFQAAHEKIFKAMDTDKDGTLTIEEIQAFMRGGKSAPRSTSTSRETPVAKRVNSSKSDADDPTLIDWVESSPLPDDGCHCCPPTTPVEISPKAVDGHKKEPRSS